MQFLVLSVMVHSTAPFLPSSVIIAEKSEIIYYCWPHF